MKKIIALILALLMMGAVLTACGGSNNATEVPAADATEAAQASESDLDYVLGNGNLLVGITDFAPMDYLDEEGFWIGFDAEMAAEFGKYLDVSVEYVEIDWDNKILELNSKNVDCIWNGMTLTDEVKSSMQTSVPYCNNAQVVIVNKDVAADYATADACKELNFAVEAGSAGKEQADEYGFNYTEVKDQATALMEVAAGTADAAIIDSLMAAAMVGEGTGYEQLTYTAALNAEEYGVGFRKGSDLAAKFDEFFAAAVADGTVDKIAEKYGVQAALIK